MKHKYEFDKRQGSAVEGLEFIPTLCCSASTPNAKTTVNKDLEIHQSIHAT